MARVRSPPPPLHFQFAIYTTEAVTSSVLNLKQLSLDIRPSFPCTNASMRCVVQYNDLLKKKTIVENDKSKIAELISELDQKKNEALEGAYERVNEVI